MGKELHSEDIGKEANVFIPEKAIAAFMEMLEAGMKTKTITADAKLTKEYLEELQFMEEPVQVMVHSSAEQFAERFIVAGVNNKYFVFPRGVSVTAPRKFIDAIIVRKDEISTPLMNLQGGEVSYGIQKVSNLKYPVSIEKDPSPEKGREWFERRVNELV